MKNVKSFKADNLKATDELDELVEYGRKLHSEAVFMGVLKIFTLFGHDFQKRQSRKNLKIEMVK